MRVFQDTTCVVSIFRFRTLIHTYCPNLNILNLTEVPSNVGDTVTSDQLDSDESDEDESDDDMDEDVEEMAYMMEYGNISDPSSDKPFKMAKEMPPFNNIRTVRIVDSLVAGTSETMFAYQLFALCFNVSSASIFGKESSALQSRTFDFVRAVVLQ